MKRNFLHSIVLMLILLFGAIYSMAQTTYDPSVFIEININSGNPAYPYPQFEEYKGGGKSLAKYNAEGVTHADMEKAGREAYEIMMHRCRYEGTYCGVKYISFNSDAVAGNYGTFVSEGDGYALLAAAIFADQKTFNGLYMWIHDIRFAGVKRFRDGNTRGTTSNDYAGPYMAAWKDKTFNAAYGSDSHSATDGDMDIAMAMLIAYKQWGEWMMQDGVVVKDCSGNPISLKYETQRVVGALVDTIPQIDPGSHQVTGYLCGDIGIDGYQKRGNSWGELTRWRFTTEGQAAYPGANGPYNGGPNLYSIYGGNYIDYDGPSYFEQFYRWLKNGDGVDAKNSAVAPWEIHQFKRAAASGNWLNKQAYNQGLYASIGNVSVGDYGANPTFGVYVDGEDFRYAWRHILDYLWHGHADYDWDPVTHQVIAGTNTSEYDMGVRHASLLKSPSNSGSQICSKLGASPDAGQPSWFGVSQIPQQWTPTGGITSAYHTNYSVGSGSVAAVASEDLELLGDIYRQCEVTWDGNNTNVTYDSEERYIGSTPKYFHGWFRTLGMLVCSGNLAAPEDMYPKANMKVYMSVDKTYAYQGDKVKYTVQYRNYGSLAAEGVKIQTPLDEDYTFVSATDGGVYDAATHTVTWNIGTVSGFKTGGLNATQDSVGFTVRITSLANSRVCETSTITGNNFDEWVSNEYPNHATYTMERNCVDILANRSLLINKEANRNELNPGDVVTFTVDFENKSTEDSWMNGGRDNVRLSYGNYYMSGNAYKFYQYYRFWNDASEAYINLSNYRVSYFMYDAAAVGLYDASTNPTGWSFTLDNGNDMAKYGWMPDGSETKFTYQKIPQGEDENGKWNQRLMIQFPGALMAPSTHVYDKLNNSYLIHKGGYGPCFFRTALASMPNTDLTTRVQDDWSFSTAVTGTTLDGQTETFVLVSPCWADYDDLGYEINNYSRHVCNPTSLDNYDRVLVEEFDGYTWRRIQGRGPLPGKEAYNVTIVDTIPLELEWKEFVDSKGLGVNATYTAAPSGASYSGIVKWTVPEMLVGEKDKFVYTCVAKDLGCPSAPDATYINAAWIYSDTDSPDSSAVSLTTTCTELPPYIEPQNSLFKIASVESASVGDVINYELKYKNTTGSHVEPSCASSVDWQTFEGKNMPEISASGIKLNALNSGAVFFGAKNSYGVNGSATITFANPSNNQETYVVFRYESGVPGTASFKGIAMKIIINNDGNNNFGYFLYNNGTLVESASGWANALQFKGSTTAPVLKFVLNEDHLYLYINDMESVLKDWSGLTTSPGYTGFYVSSNGNSNTYVTAFESDFDYAFDVKLFDQIPNELTDITNISGSGIYNAGTQKITWPVVAGPLAPNAEISYTFDAKVYSCNSYINNYGMAKVYGQDTLKVVNSIKCGTTVCPDPPTVTSPVTLCKDATVSALTAVGKNLKWYTTETNGTPSSSITPSTTTVGKTTYYVSQTDGCESQRTPLVVDVIETEAPQVVTPVSLCLNAPTTALTATGTDLTWYNSSKVELTGAPTPDASQVADVSYYVTQTLNDCESEMAEIVVSVGALAKPTVQDVSYCQGATATALTATASGTLVWYESGTATTALASAPIPSTTAEGTTSYFVSQTSGDCESDRAEIKVTIKSSPISTISATKDSYCGTTSTIVLSLTSGVDLTSATYSWKKDATAAATTATVTTATKGEYVCLVTLNGCEYTTPSKTITENPSPKYTITGAGSYCPESTSKDDVVITFTAGTAPFSFDEAITGTGNSATSTYTITNPAGGIYQLTSLTDANNCSMTETGATIEVVDLDTPDLTIGAISSMCAGTVSVDVSTYVTAGAGTVSYTTDKGTVSSAGVLTGLDAAGEYTVSVTVTGTTAPYCTNTKDAVVIVSANPVVTLDATYTVCSGTDLVLTPTVTSTSTSFIYAWSGDGSSKLNSTSLESVTFNATVSADTDYTLDIEVVDKNSTCSGTASTNVTVYALPTAQLTTTQNYVCSDADITVTATVSDDGSGTGVWTNATEDTELTATVDGSTYSAGVNTVSYVYTDAHSCSSIVVTKDITVVAKPDAPTATTISYCLNATAQPLAITGYSNLLWYGTSKTNIPTTTAPTPLTNNEGVTIYYVSQVVDQCESDIAEVTVIIKSKLEPQINLSKSEVCAGTAINISLSQGYNKQTWSGTAADYLNSKTMAAPEFLATAPAGSYTLTVDVEDASSCTGTASVAIQVNEVPVVNISADDLTHCVSVNDAQTITATITPSTLTGTHAWTNVSSTSSTASFVPSSKTPDDYEITYQFTSDDNCPSNVASLTMTVYALPSIGITPSKPDVCISGNNSSDITMTATQTTGTFVYSVDNGGTIATDGTFSPASNPAGDYIVTLTYTDANSCTSQATADVSIHALPTVVFDASNPDSACYTNGAFDLLINCTDEDGIVEAKTTSLNPSTSSIGTKTITYTYSDLNGCQNSADYPIVVYKVATPTIDAPNPKTVTIDEYGTLLDVASVSATATTAGDGIVWQNDGGVQLSTAALYTSPETTEGTYYYYAKETRMVDGTACYSESAKATLVLSNCPAKSPTAKDTVLCVGTDGTITLNASFAGTSTGKSLAWFSDDLLASKLVDGNSYSTTVATTAATTYTYYVAEYDDGGACWSIPTKVIANVKENPTVEIDDIATLCYASKTHTAVGKINGVASTAGTWSITSDPAAINSVTGVINTQYWGENDGSYTVTYSYTDANNCSNSASKSFSVEFPEIPTSDGFVGLTANPQPVVVTAEVSSLETGAVVKWYETASSTSVLETANSYTTGDNPATVQTVTYYLSQTVNGCESERGTSVVKIVDCPFLKPTVTSVEACQNSTTISDLAAALPSTTTVAADSWAWFDADENPLYNGQETSYASGVSTATAAVTTFYVAYLATDASTSQQCMSDKAAVTVTIHKLPTVAINDPARTLCYPEGDVQLTATVNGTANNSGNWSVTGQPSAISSMGVFNTKFNSATDGDYTVVYSYTDANNCTSQDDLAVRVEYPEVPSVANYNGLITNPIPVVLTAENIETSATVNWYLASSSEQTTVNTWTTPDDPTVAHVSTYSISQTKNGCESEKTTSTVTISDCPFKEAVASSVEICQDESGLQDLSAALPSTTTVAADAWIWYDATGNELQNSTSATYAPSVSTATAGTTTYQVSYVATDAATSIACTSPKAKVTVTVNPKPVITLPAGNKTLVCYDEGDVLWTASADYHTNGVGSGVWKVDDVENNGMSSAGVFDPTTFGKVSDTYSVSYTYTDGKSCTNTEKKDLTVQYTVAPAVTGHSSLVEDNATVSISATPTDASATITWYNAMGTKLSNNNPYETGDPGNVVTSKSYFATQTINTCESEKAEAKVSIINCPIPKPIVVQPAAICNYDNSPELIATLGTWTSGTRPTAVNPEILNFYDVEFGGIPLSSSATGSFIPTIDDTKAATYTYYVAEYNENVLPSACEGKRAKITLKVMKPLKPDVRIEKNNVCQGQTNPQCSATGQGSIQWYENSPSYPAGVPDQESSSFIPSATEVGEHYVWATQTVDGCLSDADSVSFIIKAIPAAPTTENATICYGAPKTTVCVQGNVGTVTWYSDINASEPLTKATCYSPSDVYADEYSYYATQTVDGCESGRTKATYTIIALPSIPMVTTENYSCDYDSEHVMSVTEQSGITVAWFTSSDTASLLATGNEFRHQITESGTVTYYVRQIANGCASNYVTKSFTVVARPSIPKVQNDVVCYGTVASLSTDGYNDMWYGESSLETIVAQGRNFNVDEATANQSYYVVREKNGCISETAEATVTVIPVPDVTITVDGEETSLLQRCVYEEEKPMIAAVSPVMTNGDYVSWFIFPGNITLANDSLLLSQYVPVSSQNTSNIVYTIRAQYMVKNNTHNSYCESVMDTIKVSTSAKARKPIVLSDVICQGEEIEPMFAFGTPNVTWISLDGILPIEAHGQRYEFSKQQIDIPVGEYSFLVYDIDMNTGCHSDTVTTTLTLAPAAQTKIFGTDSVCVNSTETYYTQYSEGSQYHWSVTGGNLNYTKDVKASSVQYVDWNYMGIDTLIVFEQTWAGCQGADTLVVKIANAPQARFVWELPGEANVIRLSDSTVQDSIKELTANGDWYKEEITYTSQWNYGHLGTDPSGVDLEVPYKHRFIPIIEGDYTFGYNCPILTVRNSFGCSDSYSECIFINVSSNLFVPTAFAPTNPSEEVRYFQPKGYNLKTCKISIYDKWGNLVWYSDAVEEGAFVGKWDGRCNGKLMESGTYIWKMEAMYLDGQSWEGFDVGNGKKSKFGNVMLIR